MEYRDVLYSEYLKTLYNVPNKPTYLKEQFKYWLEEKEKILPLYVQFLIALDLNPSKGVVEINKSEKDSTLPYMPYDTKGILVSKNTRTKILDKNGIININGNLILNENEPKIEYQKKILDISNFKNFITQFPINDETKTIMAELMNTDKNVFIGTYGKMKDKNRRDNLKDLYDLKQQLSKYLNKNITDEVIYTSEFYLAAITPKLKYKEKK